MSCALATSHGRELRRASRARKGRFSSYTAADPPKRADGTVGALATRRASMGMSVVEGAVGGMSTRRMSADRAAIVAVLCAVAAAGCSSSNDDLESHEAESQTGKLPPEAEVQAVKPPQVQLSQQCITL